MKACIYLGYTTFSCHMRRGLRSPGSSHRFALSNTNDYYLEGEEENMGIVGPNLARRSLEK
jgi:hypothetical protein